MTAKWMIFVLGVLIISSSQSSATDTFEQQMHNSMEQMQHAMNHVPMTGDPDQDFARMMIPHHQGAISMAEAILEKGNDPKIRQMAQEMVEKQKQEIKELQAWLETQEGTAGGQQ